MTLPAVVPVESSYPLTICADGVPVWPSSLGSRARSSLPESSVSPRRRAPMGPRKETGDYPIPDRGHAISAKRLSRKQRKAGNLTSDEFDRINRKADKVLTAE